VRYWRATLPADLGLPFAAVAASAVVLTLALARPEVLRVGAGDTRARHALRSFGPPVTKQQRAGRWSRPDSVIVLHGVGAGDSVLALQVAGGTSGRPQSVSLAPVDDGRRVDLDPGTFAVSPDWREYSVRLKVASWPPSVEPVELSLRSTPYRRGADGGDLGVRVAGLSLQPVGGVVGRFAAAAPAVALWTWALALVAVLATRGARRLATTGRPDRAGAVVVGIAGLILSAFAWRDPYGLAWTLPPPVVSLALVTLALLLAREGGARAGAVSAERGSPGREAWAWALALGALAVLYVQRAGFRPALFLLAGAVAWQLARLHRAGEPPESRAGVLSSSGLWLGMTLVALIALAMRFTHIRELPYGLWRDEARYGLVALRMIENPAYRPAYVPEVVSLPGLGLQMLGMGLRVWGIASWSMRTIPAFAGALTVIPLFGLARRLTGRGDVALLAAAFLAVSSWHVTVSRITSPAALHPLFELTGLWCLVEALGIGRRAPVRPAWRAALLLAGGAFIGVSLQTYHSGRTSPLMAAALIAATWAAGRGTGPRWRDLLCVAAGFAAAGAPLLAYAWHDSRRLNARAGAVFLPAAAEANAIPPVAALDASVGRHLVMFNVRGDHNGRRNVPLRPMLDPITGLGFLAGLMALWRARADHRARFLLVAVALGVLPSALAVEGPHSLRAIGAAPFACIAAAVGWQDLAGRVGRWTGGRAAGAFVALAMGALAFNAWTYFVVAPNDERVWGSFYPVETQVGTFVRDLARREGLPASERVYLSRETAESSVTEFLVHGLPVNTFDAEVSTPPTPDSLFVVARETDRERVFALAAERALGPPELAGVGPRLPDGRRAAFTLYRLP
jgi:dolichyl-phosphate-mannose-protein mannosyltransferase